MCEEMCITPGEDDDTSQAMDSDIKEIARMLTELNELAYNTYKPLVDDICARKAPEAEVEHLLDSMVGICNDDRMTELFKRVCRKYLYLYTEMITSEIYTYKEMYEAIINSRSWKITKPIRDMADKMKRVKKK